MKIEFKSLSKQFDSNKLILNNINFKDDIHTLAIIGPSGGGKSTLLRILGGLIPASMGECIMDGETLPNNENQLSLYRKQIGFVFQQGGLFHHMSATDNISIPLVKVHGYSKEDANKRSEELLTRFGLLGDAHKKPNELSGGQQQRVAIARAISAKPKILLLDEPTSALDPEYTTEVLDIINELKEEGMNFIIVTHEMGFAAHACEKVAFLYDGDLVEYGTSDEIFNHPKTNELKQFLSKLLEWNV
ncbi:MAG: amino acid ABC transporter ATP-binding protein [Erysipelotrichaceae bacterium]